MGYHNSILFIILAITFLFQSLHYLPVFALRDRLFAGDEVDSLDPSTNLVSSNGMFTLGFFTTPSTNFTYLAIWFTNEEEQEDIKIWVANPETPIIGRGLFTGLKVINGSGAEFFSPHLDGSSKNVVAYLQDIGNLYVTDKGVKYWESFDYPTDTLLASTNIRYRNYLLPFDGPILTSWLSDEVPASGAFTFKFDYYDNSGQLLIYMRRKLYWASGPWNGTARTFQFLRFVNGSRFIFPARPSDASFMLKLYPNGKFVELKSQLSLTPEFCYGYETDNGCVISALPYCRRKNDTFQMRSGDWIGHTYIINDDPSISHADCTERCWNDCTCTGFKTMHSNGTGCIFWTAASTFRVDESGQAGTNYVLHTQKPHPPHPPPPPPPPPPKRDTLYPGDEVYSFNQSSNVVSFYGAFTLGFFTIPSTNLTYLGIWLTSEPRDMITWVANRDTPIDGPGLFTARIDTPVWHVINVTTIALDLNVMHVSLSYDITAVMDDWGCLYVYETLRRKADHPFERLWQSTDHPTDTLLSISTLVYDLHTNQSRTLTSWLSDDVPALGAFTLTFEDYNNSPQLLIYMRGKLYWASGPWNSTARTFQFLSFVNGSRFIFPQHVNLGSDASGMRFSFVSDDVLLMFKLSPNGQFRLLNAQLTPEFCYGYESDNGCVDSGLPSCRGKKDSFQLTSGDWIGGPSIKDDNSSISHADCTERCWNHCTCTGFKTMHSNGTGCIFWTDATFLADESDQTEKKYVLLSPPPGPPLPPKKKAWVWILVSLAIVLLCVLAYAGIKRHIINVKENKRRDDFILQMTGSNSFNYGDELERGIIDAPDVRIFNLKAIMAATNNFSDENKLGQGGYGPVYRLKIKRRN